uniref:Natural killer cells antigen CD94 n=1 Tax=Chrysemys picta bellii TaxID=8478 RepID=A0A8C3HKT6_CHRPI
PWRYVAVILGILCVVLLGAVGFQSVKRKYFQERQRKDSRVSVISAKRSVLLTNFSLCPENWIQHEEDCYHFSTEWRTWQESKDYCPNTDVRLRPFLIVPIQDFIKPLSFSYHWIGLFCNGINESWVWEDGALITTSDFAMFAEHPDFNSGDCAAFRIGEAHSYGCEQSKPYICEQRAILVNIDILPLSCG